MAEVTITTNNVPRDIINAWQLTANERKEFDYLNWEAIENGEDSADFFRYRGELYDMHEFERLTHNFLDGSTDDFEKWQAYQSDSYFSGILFRYVNSGEQIIVGRYCC